MNILVLGASGMLGSTLMRRLPELTGHPVWGTVRRHDDRLPASLRGRLIEGVEANDLSSIEVTLRDLRPALVLNCVGIIKQLKDAHDPIPSLRINALFPHELARLCAAQGCRMLHFSTDCVFSGRAGNYTEADSPDPVDLYGHTKLLGEVTAQPHVLTLRTSIIGHEPGGRGISLIDWFLNSRGTVRGFRRAIYSGVPTIVMARFIASVVLARPELSGLWHLASEPIDKFQLLQLVRQRYGKTDVEIVPDDALAIDRSLSAQRLHDTTGYRPPAWADMIADMHNDHLANHHGE